MQKSLGPESTALRRPLRVLLGNKALRRPESGPSRCAPPAAARRAESVLSKPIPPSDAARPTETVRGKAPPPADPGASTDAVLDCLVLARSDLASIVSQIDEVLVNARQCQTVSTRGKQEIESFNVFLSNTNASLKWWSSRLKQALETRPTETEIVPKQTLGIGSNHAVKRSSKMYCSNSNFPAAEPLATPSCKLLSCNKSNLPEDNMTLSPSPLVSWPPGACMVENGEQLFLLTPLPKAKGCSSRFPASKTQLKTASSMDQLDLPSIPVWKLTIADDDHPDPKQAVKVKEARTSTATPSVTTTNKGYLDDRSPCTSSVKKNIGSVPRSCLKTALSSKQPVFSPISEGSRKEDISSDGTTQGDKLSKFYDSLSSSDKISKDLASRYDLYGFSKLTCHGRDRKTDDTLQWFLSPLKTCVLMDPPDDYKENSTPSRQQYVPDDKPVQTPALHSKPLLATPWRGLESTNVKGRRAGETTLKRELWTRFEAASTNELHFDKSLFQKIGKCLDLDMLEEAT